MALTLLTPTFSCNFSTFKSTNSSIIRPNQYSPLSINSYFRTVYSYPQSFLLSKNNINGRPNMGFSTRLLSVSCSYNSQKGNPQPKGGGLDWPILKRWDVPWPWQTISLTSLACGISFVVTGLIEAQALPFLGINFGDLSLDEKAELLFLDQGITTAAVLGVLFSLTKSFQPLPDDLYRYDLREPFNLQKGWLLWAGIGFAGALGAIALTGVALSFFSGENPQRETDALVRLLPLIGSSEVSTGCLLGITGVLAPLLEETVFRGFFMASMTKWYAQNGLIS